MEESETNIRLVDIKEEDFRIDINCKVILLGDKGNIIFILISEFLN